MPQKKCMELQYSPPIGARLTDPSAPPLGRDLTLLLGWGTLLYIEFLTNWEEKFKRAPRLHLLPILQNLFLQLCYWYLSDRSWKTSWFIRMPGGNDSLGGLLAPKKWALAWALGFGRSALGETAFWIITTRADCLWFFLKYVHVLLDFLFFFLLISQYFIYCV